MGTLLLSLIATASAGADLQTSIQMPSGHEAYEEQRIRVRVSNVGNSNAKNSVVVIDLPESNTTPVIVVGDMGTLDSKCTQSGTQLTCDLGRIKRNRTKTVNVYIALPWSVSDLEFSATASTSNIDSNPGNDSDTATSEVNFPDLVIAGGDHATNTHCTGTNLGSFYVCTAFPSSLMSHGITFESDGTISFDGAPAGYTGEWGQASDDSLWFDYSYLGSVVAEFDGNAVDADCFEGLTVFTGSSYVAGYEVCLD
jgi:hypothetical protein